MSICVKVENLAKRFWLYNERRTTYQLLKKIITRKQFKKEFWVLNDISFSINQGEKVAIIGKNGSGKTTLLRILAGICDKTEGVAEVTSLPIVIFNFLAGINADLPVIDNIYMFGAMFRLQRSILKTKIDEILEMTELRQFRFLSFRDLSSGQKQRLALGVFFQSITANNFFMLDESFSSVDYGFIYKSEKYLQSLFSCEKTVITTSHEMKYLRKYCQRAIWLDQGKVKMDGEINATIDAYEEFYRK